MPDDDAREDGRAEEPTQATAAVPDWPADPYAQQPYAQQAGGYGPPPGVYGPPPGVYGPPPGAYGPPPGYPQQPGYAGPPPGYYGPTTSGRATAVLVCGIASLVLLLSFIGFIPAIVALVLARGAQHEIEESGGRLVGLSQVRAGRICSWITIAITALAILALVAFAIIGFASDGFADRPYPTY